MYVVKLYGLNLLSPFFSFFPLHIYNTIYTYPILSWFLPSKRNQCVSLLAFYVWILTSFEQLNNQYFKCVPAQICKTFYGQEMGRPKKQSPGRSCALRAPLSSVGWCRQQLPQSMENPQLFEFCLKNIFFSLLKDEILDLIAKFDREFKN